MSRLFDVAIEAAAALTSDALPVDPRRLADRLRVEYYEHPFSPDVDGLYFRTSDGAPHIYINNHWSKPPGRRLFTALHEIGHHAIAERVTFTRRYFLDAPSGRLTPIEAACNRFAAAVLMPEPLIRVWYNDLRGNPTHRAEIIANSCGVTVQAIEVRLRQLGLQKKRA
jgi:Zn-dependent peptidase ImmA (M78 family)